MVGDRPNDLEAFVATVTIADLGERLGVEGGKQTLGRLDVYVVQEAIA